ncbi:MAG TPA: hydantoinase B/oxoprolinase family protein, partial [Geminicoccaceae bacterium]|nr:hydantoinase B/oxoprolinase family protein [Geminicoccaceae bacterium]
FDPTGQLVAQADHVPSHQGTLSHAAKHVLATMSLDPGDVVILNHPYLGGTHHPDIMIFKPVFAGGEMVAMAGALGHHLDVGGRSPGSVATDARDVFEEGLMIPPMKLVKRGRPVDEILQLVASNIRVPHKTLGDIRAEMAAVAVGERRVLELVERFGAGPLAAIVAACLDQSERMMREDLRAYPDGTYAAEGFLDGDGVSDEPVRVRVAVTLDDGAVTVDYTGSSPEVRGPFNCSLSSVQAATFCGVRYMVSPAILQNEGCYRPIRLVAPPGTVVNPSPPAPLSGRFHTMERIANTILIAFNGARGEGAVGSTHGHMSSFSVSGPSPAPGDPPFVYFEILGGGWGATREGDGLDATFGLMANCLDTPIEALELEYPLRVERYALRDGSGGAGRFRGGLGIAREVRFLSGRGAFTNRSDAQKSPAPGVLGAGPGAPSRHRLEHPDGRTTVLPSKVTSLDIAAGDVIVMETAGGGGYGRPTERDPDAVLADVLDGRISEAEARDLYGVAIDRARGAVDAAATATLRARPA